MSYILLMMLLFLASFSYIVNGKDILSPWLISIAVFIVAVFVASVNLDSWGMTISSEVVVVIITALIAWGFGDLVGKRKFDKSIEIPIKSESTFNHKVFNVSFFSIVFISGFMILVTYFYYQYIYNISIIAGNPGGRELMFKYARYAVVNKKYNTEVPSLLNHGLAISKAIGYVFLYIVLYRLVILKKLRKNYVLLFPIGIYLIQISISTARISFIRIIAAGLIMFFIMWKEKNDWTNKLDFKIIAISMLGLSTFFVFFRLLGTLTGKTETRELWSDISLYTGSSIIAFDNYLSNRPVREFFGKETLYNLYTVLRKLNWSDIPPYNTPLDFFYFPTGRTNIYTALRRYIQDYSFFGMYFIMFCQGAFYSMWLSKIKITQNRGLSLLLFATLFYPVVELSIDEQFISSFVSLAMLYHIVYIILFYWFFVGRKKVVRNE